jgi:phosphoglycerate dehydrogenase-like enzyme
MVTFGPINRAIDFAAAAERGILISGTLSYVSPTAELIWGLMLTAGRRIAQEDRSVRAGKWKTTIGFELRGAVLGLVGLGRVGSEVVRMGRGFDMETIAWSRNLTQARCDLIGGVRCAAWDELLARSDFVVLALPGGPSYQGLMGRREFSAMKRSAFFINVARPELVDEAALVEALGNGTIAGAGLDVYEREPLPADHPLRALDNVVLMPHMGNATYGAMRAHFTNIVEDIRAYLDGKPFRLIGGDPEQPTLTDWDEDPGNPT